MRIPPDLPICLLWFYAGFITGAMAERYFFT